MSLLKNSFWNLAGLFIPSLLAIPCIGILARQLSIDEFGLFSLIFALIGYVSIFDFGLNRAIIRFVAINVDSKERIEKILGTSILILTSVGVFLAILFIFLIKYFIILLNVSNIPKEMAENALIYAGLSIPFFLITQCFTGYLEGLQKFKLLNIQKTITNSLLVTFPVIFVLIENSIEYAILGLFVARILNFIVSYLFYFYFDKVNLKLDFSVIKDMIFFGGWVTVSNIISPVMVYFDKFVLSYFTNTTNVGYYSVSTEVINKLSIIPGSIAKALFPFLSSKSEIDIKEYRYYIVIFFFSVFILFVPIFIFADEVIKIWVGEKYLGPSVDVLKVLLVGLVFNSIAQVPFTYIQAIGLSKITAVIHLSELIPYAVLMYFLISKYSIMGAAIAWTLRMVVDCIVLNYMAIQKIK